MHPNEQLFTDFYQAFSKLDHETMASCYAENARFSDPVFPELHGADIGMMWRMLCSRAQGFELTFSDIKADESSGSAHWEAHYLFSTTGRKVHNKIDATFKLENGKIVEHHDVFDLWAWTRMALGTSGLLLGWTPIVQNKVRNQAAENLAKFKAKVQSESA